MFNINFQDHVGQIKATQKTKVTLKGQFIWITGYLTVQQRQTMD